MIHLFWITIGIASELDTNVPAPRAKGAPRSAQVSFFPVRNMGDFLVFKRSEEPEALGNYDRTSELARQ